MGRAHSFAPACLLLGLLVPAHAAPAIVPGPEAVDAHDELRGESRVVARGAGRSLTAGRLEEVLIDRYGLDEIGREVLKGMLDLRVVEAVAEEREVTVSEAEIRAKWNELDAQVKATGRQEGLLGQLREQGIDPEVFRRQFRIAVLHEKLTRLDLQRSEDQEVSGAEQSTWLKQAKSARGGEEILARPWPDGIVARCGDAVVEEATFGRMLRQQLTFEEVQETAWHCLLRDAIRARMPDVSEAALAREVALEIERRRKKSRIDNPGFTLEQTLAARGRTIELLQADPSVEIAALARLWVDRETGEEGLKRAYERDRTRYEGLFGEALRTHFLFLIAGRFRNDLNPRTYEDAEKELRRMLERVGSTDDFAALCAQFSEHPDTRKVSGELGFVTRESPRVPPSIRKALFEHAGSLKEIPAEGAPVGPVRLGNPSGSAMLWISARRPSPPWEEMAEYVHEDLRARFLEGVLLREDVQFVE